MSSARLTDQQKIDVVNKYLDGFSINQLAKQYDLSRQSISSLLKRRNIPKRNIKNEKTN